MANSYPGTGGTNIVTTAAAQTINGSKTFLAGSATAVPVVVQGTAAQTADLQQWQNNVGTVLAKVRSDGIFVASTIIIGTATAFNPGGFGAALAVYPATINHTPLIVKGLPSQAADLQQWQNSAGTVLASIAASGIIAGTGNNYFNNIAQGAGSTSAFFSPNVAAQVGLMIRAFASQTANLQEWQDSAGTVLSSVPAGGGFKVGNITHTSTFDNSALPAFWGRITVNISGVNRYIPVYS